jgi:hypothetical protein
MSDTDFDQLMAESAEYLAELRADMQRMMPELKARAIHLKTWIADIERSPHTLFGWAPPLPGGGHARLLQKEEIECSKAVVAVLKKRLAMIYRAMGTGHE